MKFEDFIKIQELINAKNSLIGDVNNLTDFKKQRNCYSLTTVERAIYKSEKKESLNYNVEKLLAEHKEDFYDLIYKICDEEALKLSKTIDEIDKKLEVISIDFGVGNGEEKSNNEN